MYAKELHYRDGNFGAKIYVCDDPEIICDGVDCPEHGRLTKKQLAAAICGAITDSLESHDLQFEFNGAYRDWRGAWLTAPGAIHCGLICSVSYIIETITDDNGELLWEQCKYMPIAYADADKVAKLKALLMAASEAGSSAARKLCNCETV